MSNDEDTTLEECVTLNGCILSALEAVTPREPKGRYPLHYVLMEDGNLVASNGAVLAVVDVSGFDHKHMYGMQGAERFGRGLPVTLKRVDGGMDAEQGNLTVHMPSADQEDEMMRDYPPYKEMVEGEPEGNTTAVGIDLLRKLLDVCEAAGNEAVRITVSDDPMDIVRVDADDRQLDHIRGDVNIKPVTGVISPVVQPEGKWEEE